jgi:hypothetical protein
MAVLALLLLGWATQLGAGLIDCSGQSCVFQCSAEITVDRESSADCRALGASVVNRTCSSFQDVLNALAAVSGYGGDDCIAITLLAGTHKVTSNVTIDQNVVLKGVGDAVSGTISPPPPSPSQEQSSATITEWVMTTYDTKIEFSLSDDLLPSNKSLNTPFHVLSFVGGALLSIATLQMSGSPGSLEIVNVSNVEISNSSFSFFTQGAIDIYNSPSVSITSCDFFHNGPVYIIKTQEYKGHAGGLSVGYNYMDELSVHPSVSITGCTFFNNSAEVDESFTTTQVLIERVFPGRGGALSLLINSITMVTMNVTYCNFINDFASSFGGGVYTILDGLSNHIITFQSCDFVDNLSGRHAGALQIGFGQNGNEDFSNRVVARDCRFLGNQAEYGGAVYVFYIGMTPGTIGS